jgi:50S ribosomal protein L16 3-hydroxylase
MVVCGMTVVEAARQKSADYNRHKMIPTLLGGLTPQQFLDEYWQKKPLLVRQAVPGFTGLEALRDRNAMIDLACRDDVESRFVARDGDAWTIRRGPFGARDFKQRRNAKWTVLAQGVNLHVAGGDQLMRQFNFIPYARLDDLMVSYAVDGGGVGPHFDNYDVFLLQGIGQRRWRIGAQRDKTLIDGIPLKILSDFKPSRDWTLNSGDLLYLPPQWAHDGVGVGECMTWSIGFRTAPTQEVAEQFLFHLQDTLELGGRYADPGLRQQKHPAEIGTAMIDQVEAMLTKVRWNRATVRNFLGRYLTEPKSQVYFSPPEEPLSAAKFAAACDKRGLRLDPRTQLLFSGNAFFINGEEVAVAVADRKTVQRLADNRELENLGSLSKTAIELLHCWYCDGFLALQ